MAKKKKSKEINIQKVFVFLLILIFASSLVLIKVVVDNSRIKASEITVYDQNGNDWTPVESDGILRLREVISASDEDIAKINPGNLYTVVCGYLEQRPETHTINCADFGVQVYDMKWDVWEASGASGTGFYSILECEPDCANGTRTKVPVEVKLSGLMTDGTRMYLTSFNAYSLDGSSLDMGWQFPWVETELGVDENGKVYSLLN